MLCRAQGNGLSLLTFCMIPINLFPFVIDDSSSWLREVDDRQRIPAQTFENAMNETVFFDTSGMVNPIFSISDMPLQV